MYMFIYEDNSKNEEFAVVDAYSDCHALQNFYEYVGGNAGISNELFIEMILNISFEKAVTVFNTLCPFYKIKRVFKNADEIDLKEGAENG